MAKASLLPSVDPVQAASVKIAQFLATNASGEIDYIHCKPTCGGLLLVARGDEDQRYLLRPLESGADATATDLDSNRTYTLQELLGLKLPAPPVIIEGLLHEGETLVVAGRQKVGKSRLTQQMALCLAAGESFLGMNVPKPLTVLMMDFENRLAPLSNRFKSMGVDASSQTLLHIWCAASLDDQLPDATPEGTKFLHHLVNSVRPDVLIIDPWRLWLCGDENDANSVVQGLKILAGLRRQLPNLAIVIVHHVRKEKFESPRKLLQDPSLWADAVSGHHALTSHVDACYGLERQMDGDEAIIAFGGIARNLEPRTLILEDDESLRFNVAENEDAATTVMTPAESDIWAQIKGLQKFGFTQALKASNSKNRKALSQTLKIAKSHGLLRKEGDTYFRLAPIERN